MTSHRLRTLAQSPALRSQFHGLHQVLGVPALMPVQHIREPDHHPFRVLSGHRARRDQKGDQRIKSFLLDQRARASQHRATGFLSHRCGQQNIVINRE